MADTNTQRAGRAFLFSSTVVTGLILAAGAHAQDTAKAMDTTDVSDLSVKEVIIKAERSKAAANAPSKASLDEGQPRSIVSRPFIDQSVSETADFTSIASLTPSAVSSGSPNGAGWGETKLSLRGFSDGQFNITYDGIAWGDTNDPTHHSNSFFPASTIGATIVDRGPGEAGDLGQANFGGNVKLFSNKITDGQNLTLRETIGSFGGWQSVAVLQTGKIEELGGLKGFFNVQANGAQGAQTHSPLHANNLTMKFTLPIGQSWAITAFATKNYNYAHQTDNGGATLAQVAMYGKNFNLSDDPAKSTYFGYNYIIKNTNFEYLKETGDLPLGFKLDNTSYSYFYKNDTYTANDVTSADGITNAPGAIGTFVSTSASSTPAGKADHANDIRGYNKLNKYLVQGDIARFTRDFSFGELRFGGWWEKSATNRHTYDYDATLGAALAVPDHREKPVCVTYNSAGTCTANAAASYSKTYDSTSYEERSSWWQTQYFADFDWRVTDKLTITPGVKQVTMKRTIAAPVIKKPRRSENDYDTFSKTLDFLTVNYKITRDWSVYSQYANGFLMPPLGDLYVANPSQNTAEPETTVNYQYGTVYQSRHLAIDADIYRIDVNNLYQADATGNSYINAGHAYYRGVEGQVSYAFDMGLTLFANGSINKTRNDQGNRLKASPKSTAGFGAIYKQGPLSASLLYKQVGEQVANTNPEAFVIKPYDATDLAVNYDFTPQYRLKFQVSNLMDRRAITKIGPVNGGAVTSAFDQYYYQAPANVQLTLIARY